MITRARYFLLTSAISWLFLSCTVVPPEKYFDLAVLNTNLLMGFADEGFQYQLDNPSVKMVAGSQQPVALQRKEEVEQKLKAVEENLEKLRSLKVTDDTREMLQTSIALHEFVVPVYKNDYKALAKLYDEGASRSTIEAAAKVLHDNYYPRFDEWMKKITAIGKAYALKHDIKVNWGR